jgi:hypothetical protein
MVAFRKTATRWTKRVFLAFTYLSIEVFFATLCLLAGIPILIDPAALSPSSILHSLPGWEVYFWGGGLVSGGSLTLGGIAIGDKRVERAGMAALGAVSFVLAISIIFSAGVSLFLPVLTYLLFSAAILARYWVLGQEIKISRKRPGGG